MRYLLDTYIVSYLEDPDSSYQRVVANHMRALQNSDELYVSILTIYEINYGISNILESSPEFASLLMGIRDSILGRFEIIPLSLRGAEIFGSLKTAYRKASRPQELDKHNVDFIIASTALEIGAILVSNDHIFPKIVAVYPELRLENWTVSD